LLVIIYNYTIDARTHERQKLGSTLHTWSQACNKASKRIWSNERRLLWRWRTTDSIRQTTNDRLNEITLLKGGPANAQLVEHTIQDAQRPLKLTEYVTTRREVTW